MNAKKEKENLICSEMECGCEINPQTQATKARYSSSAPSSTNINRGLPLLYVCLSPFLILILNFEIGALGLSFRVLDLMQLLAA